MPSKEARGLRKLIGKIGLSEASRLLDLHHSSLTRVAAGLPVLETTREVLIQRLEALARRRTENGS